MPSLGGPPPDAGSNRFCEGCSAPLQIDDIAVDVVVDRAPPTSLGARAMQSQWLAHVYERWWRPAVFGVSTGLRMPRADEESGIVLAQLARTAGPWLDLSCGPATLTRELLAHSGGRTVVGVDLSRAMLQRAHHVASQAVLVRADAAALPFDDGTFGAVVNLAALDLYPDAARVIAESARVLARGGRWVGSTLVATHRTPFLSNLVAWAGVRFPMLDELATWVKRAGLEGFTTVAFGRYVLAWADKC